MMVAGICLTQRCETRSRGTKSTKLPNEDVPISSASIVSPHSGFPVSIIDLPFKPTRQQAPSSRSERARSLPRAEPHYLRTLAPLRLPLTGHLSAWWISIRRLCERFLCSHIVRLRTRPFSPIDAWLLSARCALGLNGGVVGLLGGLASAAQRIALHFSGSGILRGGLGGSVRPSGRLLRMGLRDVRIRSGG